LQYGIEASYSAFPFGFLPENVGTVSDEHGENFRQNFFPNSIDVRWKWIPNTLADCYWSLMKETPTGENNRQ